MQVSFIDANKNNFITNGESYRMETTEKKKALLIINPYAGRMKSRTGLFDISHTLSKNGYETTVHSTTKRGDATEFVANIDQDYSVILCCGGDGTLNEVITGMMRLEKRFPIAYIPTGTANDLAASLGLPRNIKKATDIAVNGKVCFHDVGMFNNSSYFTYVASFGAFTKVSYATTQQAKNAVGYLAYLFEGIKNMSEIKPYRVKIVSNDTETEGEFLFGAVMNTLQAGGVLKMDKRVVDFADGKFEVLLIRKPNNAAELSELIRDLAKGNYDHRYITLTHTDNIVFESDEPLSWTLDGEFGGDHSRVEISNLHNAVEIMRP
jgi:diacylglycerol kinase (ATP)